MASLFLFFYRISVCTSHLSRESYVTRRIIVSDLNNPGIAYLTSGMNYEGVLMQVSSPMLLSFFTSKYIHQDPLRNCLKARLVTSR